MDGWTLSKVCVCVCVCSDVTLKLSVIFDVIENMWSGFIEQDDTCGVALADARANKGCRCEN